MVDWSKDALNKLARSINLKMDRIGGDQWLDTSKAWAKVDARPAGMSRDEYLDQFRSNSKQNIGKRTDYAAHDKARKNRKETSYRQLDQTRRLGTRKRKNFSATTPKARRIWKRRTEATCFESACMG